MTNTTKETIHDLVAELEALRLPVLQARYAEALGEATRCPNRRFLIRQICNAWRQRHEEENATNDEDDPGNVEREDELQGETSAEPPDQAECEAGEAADDAPEDDGLTGEVPTTTQEELQPNMDSPDVPRQRGQFSGMTIEELQAKYVEVVGRQTHSEHRGYLCWKIREAERGRIRVGRCQVRQRAHQSGDVKVLPLRLKADTVAAMDHAWRSQGITSRMEFFRRALKHYLTHLGAEKAAGQFADE